ncbi:MAG: hypothetical protein L0027_04230 [Candidatus Rokubacteria bacterium]|nr:hypothetical protein [Candidatus Rokubacteria bacterium]
MRRIASPIHSTLPSRLLRRRAAAFGLLATVMAAPTSAVAATATAVLHDKSVEAEQENPRKAGDSKNTFIAYCRNDFWDLTDDYSALYATKTGKWEPTEIIRACPLAPIALGPPAVSSGTIQPPPPVSLPDLCQ